MKRSKKILIERYVNLRCKKLQEQSWLDKVGSGIKAVGESPLSNLAYLNPVTGAAKAVYDGYDVGQEIYSGEKSPGEAMAQKVGGGMDALQTGLDIAGAAGAFYPPLQAADLLNMGISGVRGGIEYARGNEKAARKHGINTVASGIGSIPGLGDAVNLGKIGVKWGPEAYKAGKGIYNTLKPAGEKIGIGLKNLDKNKGFKGLKYGQKLNKADQKGYVTGNPGELNQAISQNITQPVTAAVTDVGDYVQKAGQEFGSGPLSSLYKLYQGDDS